MGVVDVERVLEIVEDAVPEDHEDGAERYLGYEAAIARSMLLKGKKMATVSKAQKKLALRSVLADAAPAAESAATGPPVAKSPAAASSNPLKPLMKSWVAKTFYGIAAGYFSYDVGCEVLRKHRDGHDNSVLAATVAHGLTFHALLSFTLPAFVIKKCVIGSASILGSRPQFAASFPSLVRFGPVGVGLASIGLLPLIDGPASDLLDQFFDVVAPQWRTGGHHHHGHGATAAEMYRHDSPQDVANSR